MERKLAAILSADVVGYSRPISPHKRRKSIISEIPARQIIQARDAPYR